MSEREDRPRLSWSEIDKRRSGARSRSDEPRGRRAREDQVRASESALKEADALFSQEKGGSEGERLANEMRDAHGTPALPQACRTYREQIGVPQSPALLALFLDAGDRDLVVPALEALLALQRAGRLEIGTGLRSQLRVLEQDRDDTVAGLCEDLLAG